MNDLTIFPVGDDLEWLVRYSKLYLHTGAGNVNHHSDPESPIDELARLTREAMQQNTLEHTDREFEARFFVPPDGNCLIFLRWPHKQRLSRNFGEGLTVGGESPEGPFCLRCPRYYIKLSSPIGERTGWAIAHPVNQPAIVSYGEPRPVATVTATINNLDFDCGNQPETNGPKSGEVLRVEGSGRNIDFAWRSDRGQLRRLVDAELLSTTSFVTFSFAAWPGAADDELISFADNVSSLCSYVAGQHTGTPILSLFDAEGRVIRRILREAIQSRFRRIESLPMIHGGEGLPRLFQECFDNHCRMQETDLWNRLPFLYAAIDDPPYLEQKFATLMMTVELLIRSSLIEGGHLTSAEAEKKNLPRLVGLARGTLGWDIPDHYTEGDRYRLTRNAVDHGGSLPHDIDVISDDFDKWKLFLLRRLFIRLGFDGEVRSPQNGWASSSPVARFTEEHNSFRR